MLALLVLCVGTLWSAPAAAIGTERYFNPVCYGEECDQFAAYSECQTELAIAKADPNLQVSAPFLYCHHDPAPYALPKYHLAYQGASEDWNLSWYQNTFPYKVDAKRGDPNLGCCAHTPGAQSFGDPVNAATGNKYETEPQFAGEGVFPLSLSLTYNSTRAIAYSASVHNIFGRNRTHSYFRRVDRFVDGGAEAAYLSRPGGARLRFLPSGGGWVTDRPGVGTLTATMTAGVITGWQFEDERGARETFDASGKLVERHDLAGFRQTLDYDASGRLASVTDPNGRRLVFTYGGNGLVAQVTLPDGNVIGYAYTAGGDLRQVTFPGGTTRQYLYDEAAHVPSGSPAGILTGEIDEAAQRFSTTTYSKSLFSRNPKAKSTVMAGGVDAQSATFSWADTYQNHAATATVTLPLGATRQLTFARIKDLFLLTAATTTCTGCVASSETYTYDANGQWNLVTRNGVTTDHDINTRGLEIQRIEAANDTNGHKRTTQTDWHATLRVPTERRILDAAGALKSKATWTYNARGQVLTQSAIDPTVTPNLVRTTAYTWCEQADVTAGICPFVGLLLTVDGPRSDVNDIVRYSYRMADEATCATAPATCPYRKGDLWKVTQVPGQTVEQTTETLKSDGAGRPLQVRDANGVVTDLEYHPRGWLTARKTRGADNAVETDDQITRIEYWPTGLVKRVTQPDGAYTQYSYDAAHRLTGIADNAGNTITYTLNAVGDRTKEDTRDPTNTLARTLGRTYNTLGQLQAQTDAYGRSTGFTYDANGNLDQTTDALGRKIDHNVDPLDRLARSLQDMTGVAAETTFSYDALDNLVQVKDPKGLNTTYSYNALGDLTQLQSPDAGITAYLYDSAGNRTRQTDARGTVTHYGYDALNRLTTVTYPAAAALDTTYTWDIAQTDCPPGETFSRGRLAKIADGSGTTVYCHDRFGNLVRKVQTTNGKVFTLRYVHEVNGRLQTVIYPDGAEATYSRDTQGRITAITVKTGDGAIRTLLHGVSHHPFGPAAQWTYGAEGMGGRVLTRTLNQNYQPGIVQDLAADGLSLGYEFDEVGNLKRLRNGNQNDPPLRIYGYDGLNRLTEAKDGATSAVLQGYAYDKTGNRTSATVGTSTAAYSYPATSHRLTTVGTDTRAYDSNGNTTQIPGAVQKNFVYGDHNRMTQYSEGTTVRMTYAYNGKGEQVRKTANGTTNVYSVYDEAGHWLGEYDNTGAATQQVIWLNDLPVGLLVGASSNQTLHYIEPDALGTPRVVIDPARGTQGTTIWRWDLTGEAFGATVPNQDPDGDATQFVFDMRFPGQRYDAASGLNYNYFRDYDASTGRYIESDPIGLEGGIGSYSYSESNALIGMDRLGLAPSSACMNAVIGACTVGGGAIGYWGGGIVGGGLGTSVPVAGNVAGFVSGSTLGGMGGASAGGLLGGFAASLFCPEESRPSSEDCNKAIKLLKQVLRLAEKLGKKLPPRRIEELIRKINDGTITSSDLPASIQQEFPPGLRGKTLSEIMKICGKT